MGITTSSQRKRLSKFCGAVEPCRAFVLASNIFFHKQEKQDNILIKLLECLFFSLFNCSSTKQSMLDRLPCLENLNRLRPKEHAPFQIDCPFIRIMASGFERLARCMTITSLVITMKTQMPIHTHSLGHVIIIVFLFLTNIF